MKRFAPEEEEEEEVALGQQPAMEKRSRTEEERPEPAEEEMEPPIIRVTIADRADPGATMPTFSRTPDGTPPITVLDAGDMFRYLPARWRAEALAEAIVRAEIAIEERERGAPVEEATESFIQEQTQAIAKAWLDAGFATGRLDVSTRRREALANVAAKGGLTAYNLTSDHIVFGERAM